MPHLAPANRRILALAIPLAFGALGLPHAALAQNMFSGVLNQTLHNQAAAELGVRPVDVNREQQQQAERTAQLRLDARLEAAMQQQERLRSERNGVTSLIIKDLIAGRELQRYLEELLRPIPQYALLSGGAGVSVPFGSYSGDSLVYATASMVPRKNGGIPIQNQRGLQQLGHGWRFEPAGMLVGSVNVVQVGDVPEAPICVPGSAAPCQPPVANSRPCLFGISYRYVGPGGAYTFLPEGETQTFPMHPRVPVAQQGSSSGACLRQLYEAPTAGGDPDDSYVRSRIPKTLRSTHGAVVLDLANLDRPVLRYPDGSVETMGTGERSAGFVLDTQYEAFTQRPHFKSPLNLSRFSSVLDPSSRLLDATYSAVWRDRNGQTRTYSSRLETRYQTIAGTNVSLPYQIGLETIVTDEEGRVTRFLRDDEGEVREIRAPGPLGQELVYRLTWTAMEWDPSRVMPDVLCFPYSYSIGGPPDYVPITLPGEREQPCPKLRFRTLTEIAQPDGTKFEFGYRLPSGDTSWGALTEMTSPGGAVHRFRYGDAKEAVHWPLPVTSALGFQGQYPEQARDLAKRILVEEAVYPLGPGQPGHARRIRHEFVEEQLVVPGRAQPETLRLPGWVVSDRYELNGGSERLARTLREYRMVFGDRVLADELAGRMVATETLDTNGDVVEGTYFGQSTMTRDRPFLEAQRTGAARAGGPARGTELFVQADTQVIYKTNLMLVDVRPRKVVHFRDGVWWIEGFEYDRNASGGTRTNGNVTRKQLSDAAGNVVLQTDTKYKTDASYLAKNLVQLPEEVMLSGHNGRGFAPLSRTSMQYDTLDVVASNDDRLDRTVGRERGNATVVTRHKVTGSMTRSLVQRLPADTSPDTITTTTQYFDNGAAARVTDALNRVTTMKSDFRACSASDAIRESSVASPDPGSGAHVTTTRRDCFTGLVLSVVDANGNRACMQYDRVGRGIESALPGDRLSALADGIRDPSCETSGIATLGSGGNGPTTWTEYRDLGAIGPASGGSGGRHQRTISYTKNGSGAGTYVKTFMDGLGRVIQTCDQVDPATNGGRREVCTYKAYDHTGRTDTEYLPYYLATGVDDVSPPPPKQQYTLSELDALGRPTRVELVNSGVKPRSYSYGSDGTNWIVEATDPNGNRTITGTNLLGHTFQVSRASTRCVEDYCTMQTIHDALGRVLAVTGPRNKDGTGGHTMTRMYDGQGRVLATVDPSLGLASYAHDAAGNVIERRDAKGQVTTMSYDALNRLTTRTSANVAGDRAEERVTRFGYDGTGSWTTTNARGRQTSIGNDLVHRAFAFDAQGRVIEERFTPAGGAAAPAPTTAPPPPPPSPSVAPNTPANPFGRNPIRRPVVPGAMLQVPGLASTIVAAVGAVEEISDAR